MPSLQPALFRLVRQQAGESQKDFARRFGVRQAVWSKYESGAVVPPEKMVAQLCAETGYARSFFEQPAEDFPDGLVFHRKRSALPAAARERIEAEARLRAMDAAALCRARAVRPNVVARNDRTPEEVADELRALWNLGEGPIENLVDAFDRNGVVILTFDFGTDLLDGFFLRHAAEDLIFIALNDNAALPADRRHFTLAHELGHALLHREAFPDKTTEEEANRFAGQFLLPDRTVRNEFPAKFGFDDLKRLKGRWKVSMSAILYRAWKVGILSDARHRSYCVYLNKIGCRKREPPCGVRVETPRLLPHLFSKVFSGLSVPATAEWLHLSESLLKIRYPFFGASLACGVGS